MRNMEPWWQLSMHTHYNHTISLQWMKIVHWFNSAERAFNCSRLCNTHTISHHPFTTNRLRTYRGLSDVLKHTAGRLVRPLGLVRLPLGVAVQAAAKLWALHFVGVVRLLLRSAVSFAKDQRNGRGARRGEAGSRTAARPMQTWTCCRKPCP